MTKLIILVQNLKFGAPKSPVSGDLGGESCKKSRLSHPLLKSFTIMEMLVALTLAGIVIASGGMLYFQFNRYLSSSINRSESENSVMLFSRAFRNDINKSVNIASNADEIIIQHSDASMVSYAFFDDFITRSMEEQTDTFKLWVDNLSISTEPGTERFYSVKADLIVEGTIYPFFLVKEYENYELFNGLTPNPSP